ncbi:hypothetical protein QOT17_021703 [Balamuthia mandrillaris]
MPKNLILLDLLRGVDGCVQPGGGEKGKNSSPGRIHREPPSNDDCINAEPISFDQVINGTLRHSTADTIFWATPGSRVTSPFVWYTFTGTGRRIVIDSCISQNNLDTNLAVYFVQHGSTIADTCSQPYRSPKMVAAGEDAFLCTENNPGGTRSQGATYILAVGSFFDEKDFSFIAYDGGQSTGRPNDRCFTAHRLTLDEEITGSNYESSWGTVPACADESDRGHVLTYIYTGQGRQITFEVLEEGISMDAVVLVFRINACGEADSWCIAGEDDHHPFPTPIEEGKHQPAVSWFAEESGILYRTVWMEWGPGRSAGCSKGNRGSRGWT